jgi:hypothetical protein
MSIFGYMKVYCPICRAECDGMRTIGQQSHTCSMECHNEWEWRKTLATLNKVYYPRKEKTNEDVLDK